MDMDFSLQESEEDREKRLLIADENLSYENYEPFIDENIIEYMLTDLGKRVKHDVISKLLVFFVDLSVYTDPINLFLKGESSVGKTYNAVETSKYFPKIDVKHLANLSPKAIYHMEGKLLDEFGKEIKPEDYPKKPRKKDFKERESEFEQAEEEYEEASKEFNKRLRKSYKLIDVSNQIWIFLETPEFGTFKTLRPLLSHDVENIEFHYTDKTKTGQFKTSKVVVTGYPATIFLTVDKKYVEELATRSFTTTPESTQDKIKESNKVTNRKLVLPDENPEISDEAKKIRQHVLNIRTLFTVGKWKIVCPFDNIYQLYPSNVARDMRDFDHLGLLIKAITALNFQQRVIWIHGKRKYILSSIEDVKLAFDILNIISETTRTGTDQSTIDFYWNIVVNDEGNTTVKQFQQAYKQKYPERKIPAQPTIRKWLDRLDELGYVDKTERAINNKIHMYEPMITERKNIEGNTLILQNNEQLSLFLEKGLKLWESAIDTLDTFKIIKKDKENKISWEKISINEVKNKILYIQNNFNIILKISNKTTLISENKDKNTLFSQNNEFPYISSTKLEEP